MKEVKKMLFKQSFLFKVKFEVIRERIKIIKNFLDFVKNLTKINLILIMNKSIKYN